MTMLPTLGLNRENRVMSLGMTVSPVGDAFDRSMLAIEQLLRPVGFRSRIEDARFTFAPFTFHVATKRA